MDLLHSGRFEGFYLVSFDRDFTRQRFGISQRSPFAQMEITHPPGDGCFCRASYITTPFRQRGLKEDAIGEDR